MNNLSRMWPYVWPHRRKVFLSFFFAGLVGLFWSLNLSVAFPVVKVLLQGQSLREYVEVEIAAANREIEKKSARIEELDQQLDRLERTHPRDAAEKVSLLQDRARQQRKVGEASRRAYWMNGLKTYVVRWLPEDQFDMLALLLIILLVATALKGLCVFVQEVLIGSAVELTAMGLRKDLFRHTLTLDFQTIGRRGTSDIMSRFTYDMHLLIHGLTLLGGKVVREPIKAACCLTGAFFVSWRLTLLSMLVVPIVAFVFYRIGRKLKQASHRMMESMSRIYKTLEETFESIKIVIAFDGAKRHRQRFHRENKQYYGKALKILKIDSLTSPTMEGLGLLAAFIALLPGAYLVLRGTTNIWGIKLASSPMDIAELSLLYVFLAGILDPIRKLSTTYTKLKRGAAAADRLFALMDTTPLVTQAEHPRRLGRHRESITFRDVYFTYQTGEDALHRPPVLDKVNLSVRAGEVIVVVGENGSGKSTLVNLLPRFYDPDRGSVLIDGVDIREARLRDLRGQIGVVTQETLLFDETVYENIRYGNPDATSEEIERAAREAHVTPFLDQLPNGFDTPVGERGGRLSGGQRQRIALARAILRDPAILILDEATSAIDAQSDRLIHSALRS
ncbi:MAG: ABC transporter ATP-binding protein, partial [Planctomycetaceae bacterium]